MITAYDDSIKEVVAEDVVKSEEVVEEPTVTEEETEVVEPEAVEETVEETPAEDVVKSEDKPEDKEADKEEAEKSDEEETDEDKKEETKKSTEELVEEPVVKSEDKEDEKSDEEDEEEEDKDEDKKDKKDVKKSDETKKEDEEEVLKSSDILGAFEVIFKGLTTITENQAKLTEQLTGLVTKQEEVAKSLEETPVAKELTTGVVDIDVEGKAVSFVQKSVDVEAPTEVVETEEVAELEIDYNNPDVVTQEAYKLRQPFMDKFETVASKNQASKGELDSIRYTFSSLGQGYGSAQDLQAVKDFIDKDYK